jgi:hypothetical protein
MSQYLERYLAGEYQQVWNELLAYGAAIRSEPLSGDAWTVAQETMRRVRYNIELLISRLRTLGYRFGEIPHDPGWEEWERDFVKAYPVFQPPPADTARLLDELERRVGLLPLSIRAFYLEIGGVNFIGVDPYLMTVPNASIDGVFDSYKQTTFVEYLRNSLRSGGLMDLERTEQISYAANVLASLGRPIPASTVIEEAVQQVEVALAYLRQDLLPI